MYVRRVDPMPHAAECHASITKPMTVQGRQAMPVKSFRHLSPLL